MLKMIAKKRIVRVSATRYRSAWKRPLHFLVLHVLRHNFTPPSHFLRKYFCAGRQQNVPLLPPSVLKTPNSICCERYLEITFVQIAVPAPSRTQM